MSHTRTQTNESPVSPNKFTRNPARWPLLLSVLMATACTDVPEPAPKAEARGNGVFSVGLTDAPIEGVEEVWVSIEAFDVRNCDSGQWTLLPLAQTTPYELLSYQEDIADLVPLVDLPAGDICELRVVIGDDNYLVTDGGENADLKVPSSKIKIKGKMQITEGIHTHLIIDFDAAKSVHATGAGKFVLHPVIRIEGVSYEPIEGDPLPAHEFLGSSEFEVHPWTDDIFDIGGGATIIFSPDAVEASTVFTVSRWSRPSELSVGDVYRFSPSYNFGVDPVIDIPADAQIGLSVLLDGHPRPTSCEGGGCDASIPHFSDAGLCVNFADVPPLEWYTHFVRTAACNGLVVGHEVDGERLFKPTESMTRVELLQLVARLAVQPSSIPDFVGPIPFADVPQDAPYYGLVGWASQVGLATGDGDEPLFRPEEFVNRVEAAAMFVRASQVFSESGMDSAAADTFAELHGLVSGGEANMEFSDVADESVWYYPYVYAMRDAGLMRGYGGTDEFGPEELLSRAEAATVACRAAGHCTEDSGLPHAPFAAPTVKDPVQCFDGGFSHDTPALQYGIDYMMNVGTDVLGVLPGTVEFVNNGCQNTPIDCSDGTLQQQIDNGCTCFHGIGNVVVLRHAENLYSLYAHLDEDTIAVEVGEQICAGQVLAESGDSGWGTAAHLHFQFQDTAGGEQNLAVGYTSIHFPGWYSPDGGMQPACGELQSYNQPLQACE